MVFEGRVNFSPKAKAIERLAAQLPQEDKVKVVDFVIDNSGSLDETRQQVVEILEKLNDQI